MSDPLADHLEAQEHPYRSSRTGGMLQQLFTSTDSRALVEATSTLLNRLVVLEMYLEEERGLSVKAEQLSEFVHRRYPDIEKEVEKMAFIFYGSIARREGG